MAHKQRGREKRAKKREMKIGGENRDMDQFYSSYSSIMRACHKTVVWPSADWQKEGGGVGAQDDSGEAAV